MPRVKRGTIANKKRKGVIKHAKGFRWSRKSKYRAAKDALKHAWSYAYRDRRVKKREKRALWQIQINAACREQDVPYSKFINLLKNQNIQIDRKILSKLAQEKPEIFNKILEKAKEPSAETSKKNEKD